MCGRYSNDQTSTDLARLFTADMGGAGGWEPSYSIAPTNRAPIVREHRGPDDGPVTRELVMAKWDIPQPANRPTRQPIINARIEKLTSPFWTGPFSSARVLVPMGGYFEWTGEKGDKTPHFIYGDAPLAAAGVARSFRIGEGDDERWETTFAIVTRAARDASGEVHDRMPAFVTEDLWADWLTPESLTKPQRSQSDAARSAMLELLTASSTAVASTLRVRTVDRAVNSVRTVDRSDPRVIAPVD